MVRLLMLILGVDYLRTRWRALAWAGGISLITGVVLFIDALDDRLDFPIEPFAWLLLLEGLATMAVAWTGMGGQRTLRYVKGMAFSVAAILVLAGHHHGHMILSLLFGLLFLADGLLQVASARVVRFRTWRLAMAGGIVEIAVAIFFIQPYPTHYAGTVPYCVGLGLIFGGWNMLLLASRVRRLAGNPGLRDTPEAGPADDADQRLTTWSGPPAADEHALTVHVWTPVGSAKTEARRQPIIDRYIAAVDRNGVISTGHAALESPEGIYISLYPAVEIDRAPDDFTRLLRATRENDVPGTFQPDYPTESKAWCPSTVQVRIRNYDAQRLRAFWDAYQHDTTYNLTHRNCSSTVARALDAALEGAGARVWARLDGWWPLFRLVLTPELWVAAHLRKRAATMAWTPGLTLDYARAMSMLADPRPFAWATFIGALKRRGSASLADDRDT
ncbi:HdeD family acid-resistance protein [Cupriavidus sp. 2MCAB6]|uniref:HdeD family acid-resistance protein n=1 Tax=Cupriavidus sp. 2MCAB6 TaxID=3232981 RepID=UPI003F92F799